MGVVEGIALSTPEPGLPASALQLTPNFRTVTPRAWEARATQNKKFQLFRAKNAKDAKEEWDRVANSSLRAWRPWRERLFQPSAHHPFEFVDPLASKSPRFMPNLPGF